MASESSSLGDLLAYYVDRLNDGQRIGREEILADNPIHGPEIVEHLEGFIEWTVDADSNEPLGTLGDYTLRRQIGRGGMGVVYEAWEGSMDRVVALKVLPAGVAADDRAFQRFMQEAKTAGKLHHQNIVPVYSTGIKEGTPWFSMELVGGETLAQILAKIKEAEPETDTPFGKKDDTRYFANLAEAFSDVADGLQHAHSKGVTHRDIKPSNLILDPDDRLRILDFGLARLEGQESLTLSGDFVGTPLYMSPEQARRKKIPVDHRTDVYSLGATVYEVICGRPPFRGKDHADTLSQIIERDPVEPRKVNPRVPKDLETIVLKCMRKDAGDRYATAEALAQDLRRFVRGEPIEARPERPAERLLRCLRRRRRTIIASAVFLTMALGLILLLAERRAYWRERQLQRYEGAVREVIGRLRGGALGFRVLDRQALDPGNVRGTGFQPITANDLRVLWSRGGADSVEALIADLQEIVNDIPEHLDGHFQLARAYHALGRRNEARREVQRTLEIDPTFVPARTLEWDIAGVSDGERREKLDALCEEFSGLSGWRREWLDAVWHAAWWRAGEAASAWGRLIELRRSESESDIYLNVFAEAYLQRGLVHLQWGRSVDAQADFAAARGLALHVTPELLFAKALYRNDQREAAESILRRVHARALPRDAAEIALWAVAVYGAFDDERMALKWITELEGVPCRDRLEAFLLLRDGRVREAISAGSRAVDRDRDDPIAYYLLGKALLWDLASREDPATTDIDQLLRVARRAVALSDGGSRYESLLWAAEALEQGELNTKGNRVMKTPGNFSRVSGGRPASVLATVVSPFSSIAADSTHLVVPAASASVDPGPRGGCCGNLVLTPFRIQYRIPAAEFGALEGPCWITGWAMRVDAGHHQDITTRFDRLELRLSTTTVGPLGPRFTDNAGDDETVVLDNMVEWHSKAAGRTAESWDLEIHYENWFRYDPAQGDLLVDLINHSGWSAGPHIDSGCFLFDGIGVAGNLDVDISRCNNETRGQPTCTCLRIPRTRFDLLPISVGPAFLRGDCNDDGVIDLSDAMFTLASLFLGDGDRGCDDACDSNDDGAVDISDSIATLGVLFLGNGVIPLPGMTDGGVDPTEDDVSCDASEACP